VWLEEELDEPQAARPSATAAVAARTARARLVIDTFFIEKVVLMATKLLAENESRLGDISTLVGLGSPGEAGWIRPGGAGCGPPGERGHPPGFRPAPRDMTCPPHRRTPVGGRGLG